MLAGQREKVDVQLEEFQTAFQSLETSESILRKRIDLLHKSTQDVEEMAIDGITSVFDAGFMEQWAQKATQGQRFPRIVLKMAENYLNAVEFRLPQVEEELTNVATILKSHEDYHKKHFQNVTYTSVMNASSLASLQNLHFEISNILKDLTKEYSPLSDTFTNWDGALRWFGTGMDYTEFVLPDDEAFMVTLTKLKERVEEFRPRIEQLKQNRELLIAEATKFLLYITTDIESIDEEINAPKETQG